MLTHKWALETCWVEDTSHKRPHIAWLHLYEMSGMVKFIETKISGFLGMKDWWRSESGGWMDKVFLVGGTKMFLKIEFY